jgi:hypothetical protein
MPSADPARSREVRSERLVTVTVAERNLGLENCDVRPDGSTRHESAANRITIGHKTQSRH